LRTMVEEERMDSGLQSVASGWVDMCMCVSMLGIESRAYAC
jgi:hypothetical protein